MLPRALDDVDLALINTNYAIEAKLNPTERLAVPGVRQLALRQLHRSAQRSRQRPQHPEAGESLATPEVKKFIQDKYKGAIIPAF